MIVISSSLQTVLEPLYELMLEPAKLIGGEIGITPFSTIANTPAGVDGDLLKLDEVCLITEYISVVSDIRKTLVIEGDHVLVSLKRIHQQCGKMLAEKLTLVRSKKTKCALQLRPGESSQNIYIVVSAKYSRKICRELEWKIGQFSKPKAFNIDFNIRAIFDELIGNKLTGVDRKILTEMKIKELFFFLYIQDKCDRTDNVPSVEKKKLFAAKAFLESNYIDPPTIPQLSRLVALNEFKLKQDFKWQFGTTIHAYVTELRMRQAEKLLKKAFPVAEVAEKIGYSSVSHFIARFKSLYGKTPKQSSRASGS